MANISRRVFTERQAAGLTLYARPGRTQCGHGLYVCRRLSNSSIGSKPGLHQVFVPVVAPSDVELGLRRSMRLSRRRRGGVHHQHSGLRLVYPCSEWLLVG
jgi:hypothetical protein